MIEIDNFYVQHEGNGDYIATMYYYDTLDIENMKQDCILKKIIGPNDPHINGKIAGVKKVVL